MKRFALVTVALVGVLGALGVGGYWYVSEAITPRPVPVAVIDAENALALPGTVGLLHFDVRHAVDVERSLLGREDADALLDPVTDATPLAGLLVEGGIRLRDSVDHLVAVAVVGDKNMGLVGIALGRFDVARIAALLPKVYQVEATEVAGALALTLTKRDIDTCKVSDPVLVQLSERRIVMGAPALVAAVLERIGRRPDAAVDLAPWRAFRAGKVVSAALLVPPETLDRAIADPIARMATRAVKDDLSEIRRIFAGAAFQMLPPGLRAETWIDTGDAVWPDKTARAYANWKAELDQDVGRNLPTLMRLINYLSVDAVGGRLVATATVSEGFLREVERLPRELLSLAFSGIGGTSSKAAKQLAAEEQIVPAGELPTYHARLAAGALKPFDTARERGFKPDGQSGPFAVRLQAFRFAEGEAGVIEIALEALSGELPNMAVDTMHAVKGEPRAELFITHVRGDDGRELLRAEDCGATRNALGGELKPTTRQHYIDNAFVSFAAVSGTKSVRLKPGTTIAEIASVEGHLRLRLPSRTEVRRITAPFAGAVIEASEVRVKLAEADSGTIKYEISGRSDRVLAVRALNGSAQYLRAGSSYASGRMLGAGKTVGKSFQGRPTIAEFIVASEERVEIYPFSLSPAAPRFDRWDFPKPYLVAAIGKKAFARQVAKLDLATACAGQPADRQTKPFQLCPKSFRAGWGVVRGQFQVRAPDQPSLEGNLSALELRIESVRVAGSDNAAESIPLEMASYVDLRSFYGKDYLEGTRWFDAAEPDALKDKTIEAVQGRLVVRLPKRLARLTIDVAELGSAAEDGTGLGARLIEIGDGRLKLEISGPRERIVQFVPRDRDGIVLAANNARLERVEDSSLWLATVSISGTPATLDIVFAEIQDRLDYAFDLPLGE